MLSFLSRDIQEKYLCSFYVRAPPCRLTLFTLLPALARICGGLHLLLLPLFLQDSFIAFVQGKIKGEQDANGEENSGDPVPGWAFSIMKKTDNYHQNPGEPKRIGSCGQ